MIQSLLRTLNKVYSVIEVSLVLLQNPMIAFAECLGWPNW